MRTVFADTFYWIALANPDDFWHEKASSLSKELRPFRMITSDEVLVEFLAFFSGKGAGERTIAVRFVRGFWTMRISGLFADPRLFPGRTETLRTRPDKEYSLTDCISMSIMRRHNIREVLTHDRHFAQEGFEPLLRD